MFSRATMRLGIGPHSSLGYVLMTKLFFCVYRFHFVALKCHTKATNLPLLWLFLLHHQPRTDSLSACFLLTPQLQVLCSEVNNKTGK